MRITARIGFLSALTDFSRNTPALNESDQKNNDSCHQQNVDESAHGGAGHQTDDPESEKDKCDCH
jgi:hypothetical protein